VLFKIELKCSSDMNVCLSVAVQIRIKLFLNNARYVHTRSLLECLLITQLNICCWPCWSVIVGTIWLAASHRLGFQKENAQQTLTQDCLLLTSYTKSALIFKQMTYTWWRPRPNITQHMCSSRVEQFVWIEHHYHIPEDGQLVGETCSNVTSVSQCKDTVVRL
jgi:hypothetical protein